MLEHERKELLKVAKPVFLNTDMVRAILDDKKTVMRQAIRPQPEVLDDSVKPIYNIGDVLYVRETWQDIGSGYAYKADIGRVEGGYEAHLVPTWCPPLCMPKTAARLFLRVLGVTAERLQDITHEERLREGIRLSGYEVVSLLNDFKTAEVGIEYFARSWNHSIKKSDRDVYGWQANPYVWVISFERIE